MGTAGEERGEGRGGGIFSSLKSGSFSIASNGNLPVNSLVSSVRPVRPVGGASRSRAPPRSGGGMWAGVRRKSLMKMLVCADAFGHDADFKTFEFGGKRVKKKRSNPTQANQSPCSSAPRR